MENTVNRFRLSSGIWIDLYELTMASVYFKYRSKTEASFELFLRSNQRPFYLLLGVEEAIKHILDFRFSKEDIAYLSSLKKFDDEFLKYLKNFQFKGTVWAQEDGTVIFPEEPILRVQGSLIESQILESALLNIMNLYLTLATKAARVVMSASGRKVFDFSLRRTQGQEASLAAAKSAYVAGVESTSNLLAGKVYGIPVIGTMAHSYIMSFSREIESFKFFADTFPENLVLLIDTYDIKTGLDNAVRIAKYLKRTKKGKLLGVRIDSGNLVELSKYIRATLDLAGLVDTSVIASGNLDEYQISALISSFAPIDSFGVGTHMGTSSDMPYADVVYKICELSNPQGKFIPVMKLSGNKSTRPFSKQVVRKYKDSIMEKDVIVFFPGTGQKNSLLKKFINKGSLVAGFKDIHALRNFATKNIKKLPEDFKDINKKPVYPVIFDEKIEEKTKSLKLDITDRAYKENILFLDVDTQYDFINHKGKLYVSKAEEIVPNLKAITDLAHKNNIPIISTVDTHKKNDPEFKMFPQHCQAKTPGAKKISQTLLKKNKTLTLGEKYPFEDLIRIKDTWTQIIVEKDTIDVFNSPILANLFSVIFPSTVYVYGVATEYCVKKAVLGLLKFVDKVVVVEDAIKEINSKDKEKTFLEFRKNNVQFINTAKLLEMV